MTNTRYQIPTECPSCGSTKLTTGHEDVDTEGKTRDELFQLLSSAKWYHRCLSCNFKMPLRSAFTPAPAGAEHAALELRNRILAVKQSQ